MIYDKPITIQVQDPATEEWSDAFRLHAGVNKATGGVNFNAGADGFTARLTFEMRYCKALEALAYSPQAYRILYRGRTFKVVDYDDYMEKHHTVRLVGEFYE